ncbi:hypothetical protein FHU23_004346 [Clostridium saccharobutylicum]|nr:hypothetical protein [Clostridium saccharobutylicum]NOV78935.1 hypothetical protein [Clostridium saccharobutylicum]NOW09010.1 hypothetical protein [Clostridium saccharobutylicum]NSB50471.1 hypothetical protein [Clostridium saccharobutylicum]NSB54923.1 hypothetical protein [Clostridium saccharobutylicum]
MIAYRKKGYSVVPVTRENDCGFLKAEVVPFQHAP